MRENRIKTIRFGASDLLAGATGHIDAYSKAEPNGMLKAIMLSENNYAATGSLKIETSGDNFALFSFISGTAFNNSVFTDENFTVLPRGYATTTTNVSLSGTTAYEIEEIPLWGRKIHVSISGVGASKSGTEMLLVYQ